MKKGLGLLDTGPLVSFLGSGLRHHAWTCEQAAQRPVVARAPAYPFSTQAVSGA